MSQSSIRPGDDSDNIANWRFGIRGIWSQSSIRPGDDSDSSEVAAIICAAVVSQSSIRPGDDSDTVTIEKNSPNYNLNCRNPVFALEMIQTVVKSPL